MDGCLCSLPIKIELLKFYSEYMNKEYLNVYKIFWDKYYDTISKEKIIKIGLMLLNYYEVKYLNYFYFFFLCFSLALLHYIILYFEKCF